MVSISLCFCLSTELLFELKNTAPEHCSFKLAVFQDTARSYSLCFGKMSGVLEHCSFEQAVKQCSSSQTVAQYTNTNRSARETLYILSIPCIIFDKFSQFASVFISLIIFYAKPTYILTSHNRAFIDSCFSANVQEHWSIRRFPKVFVYPISLNVCTLFSNHKRRNFVTQWTVDFVFLTNVDNCLKRNVISNLRGIWNWSLSVSGSETDVDTLVFHNKLFYRI